MWRDVATVTAVIENVLQGCLLLRLVWVGVASRFRFFAAYLGWIASAGVVLALVLRYDGIRGSLYNSSWYTNELMTCALVFCALVEVCNTVLDGFPGFQGLGHTLIRVCTVVSAVLVAVLWLPFDGLSTLRSFASFEGRTVYLSLTTMAAAFGIAAAYFGLTIGFNARLVYAVLGAYVFGKGIFYTVDSYLLPVGSHGWTVAFNVWIIVFLGSATVLLKRERGEVVIARPPSATSAARQATTRQLEAMNDALARVLRK